MSFDYKQENNGLDFHTFLYLKKNKIIIKLFISIVPFRFFACFENYKINFAVRARNLMDGTGSNK